MSQRGLIIILCLSFPSSHRSTFTSWWRVTAMRAFCVRMLTRTYCWRRRRYMLERTCFHLLAPLDSRLLLAASVKVKILFPFFFFFPLTREWTLLSSSLRAWHPRAQPQHEFWGKTWWSMVKVVWKGVCLAQLSPKLSAGNTNCITSFSQKRQYVIWEAGSINLFISGAIFIY